MANTPMQPWSGLPDSSLWRRPSAPSRRQFLQTAAGTGVVLGAGLWIPKLARADDSGNLLPTPIPFSRLLAGFGPFHFNFPGPVDSPGPVCGKPGPYQPSLINDFNGFVGVAAGSGSATDGSGLTFSTDTRFMKGVYVGVDGERHEGAFAFI